MKLSEEEKIIVKNDLCLSGASKYQTAFFDTRQYKSLRNCLLDELKREKVNFPELHLCGLSEIKAAGKEVITKHTNGIDIRIPYSYADSLITEVYARFGLNPSEEEFENIANFIKDNCDLLKVTDVPVYTVTGKDKNGYTASSAFYNRSLPEYEKLFKTLPYVVTEIGLLGRVDENSKVTYVHEMYHALSMRNKGYTDNLLHNEVLSIFMERVSALDLYPEWIDFKILERLFQIKTSTISVENIENGSSSKDISPITDQKYIVSTLLATCLFNTYHQSSDKIKNEMNDDINSILMGLVTLESVLDKYEATEEKGSSIVKRQIKRYMKVK